MVQTSYFGYIFIHFWELIALPFYFIVIYLFANYIKHRRIKNNPVYKFYVWGLFAKIIGGLVFVFVYLYVYKGGDTTAYFESSMALHNLMNTDFGSYLVNQFGSPNYERFSFFTSDTGYPLPYMYFDTQTYMVIRLINPLLIFSFSSYLLTTVLLDWIAYTGLWRLFLVFSEHYPKRTNLFALAILFFPSIIFWGSGILKDTITLSCTGWVVYCINKIFILRKQRIRFLIILGINIFIVLLIKPYVIFALFPGSLLWILSSRILNIRSVLIRVMIVPVVFGVSIWGGYYLLSYMGRYMGKFALEKIEKTAIITQYDLKQNYYHGHSFDIGITDASLGGLIRKFPDAFVAGIYRPFLWESGNAVMLITGLENGFILILTIIALFRNPFSSLRKIISDPLLFFAITFSIFFAFSVGLTTSNFGALVRFKIAYLPFFLCALFILINYKEETSIQTSEPIFRGKRVPLLR